MSQYGSIFQISNQQAISCINLFCVCRIESLFCNLLSLLFLLSQNSFCNDIGSWNIFQFIQGFTHCNTFIQEFHERIVCFVIIRNQFTGILRTDTNQIV